MPDSTMSGRPMPAWMRENVELNFGKNKRSRQKLRPNQVQTLKEYGRYLIRQHYMAKDFSVTHASITDGELVQTALIQHQDFCATDTSWANDIPVYLQEWVHQEDLQTYVLAMRAAMQEFSKLNP